METAPITVACCSLLLLPVKGICLLFPAAAAKGISTNSTSRH
jgi:hypothetical protein